MAPSVRRGSRRGGRSESHSIAPSSSLAPSTSVAPPNLSAQQAQQAPTTDPPTVEPPLVDPHIDSSEKARNPIAKRGPTCGHGTKFAITVVFQYKEWRLVPPEVRAPLRARLLNTFDIDIEDEKVQKVIDGQMQRAWRGHKYKLHDHFKKVGGEIDPTKAKNECPRGEVSQQDWEYLCDRWSEPSFLELSKKNADSRSKRKWDSRNGSKSTARHHISHGVDLDASIGHIETWRLRHWHKENGWETPELKDTYEKMIQLRQDNPPEKMSDKEILEQVLGRHFVRLFGQGRSPNISETTSTSSDPNRPSYSQLMELYLDLRGELDTMRQTLIAKEIMLPSTNTHASDHSSGPSMNTTPFKNNQDTPCQPSSEFMGENV
ncbi:hypothetical protein G4B88_010266 [Cannabis sativa]|uniref:Transposase, Ptta/En/Spm, plant n=1 Tax=Cannabis sativa TaxID=3483 RepID=A0A7J6I5E3_CANSA|nr:hypothetical protein G4B88_010266 [Cannabis sativa]